MLSYSNVSVDGAIIRLARMSDYAPGRILRYGYPRLSELLDSDTLTSYQFVLNQNYYLAEEYRNLIHEKKQLKHVNQRRVEINQRINEIRKYLLEQERECIQRSSFVATTISKAVIDSAVYSQNFDVVIFDEASMAYIPQIVFAAGLAKSNFICLGDFCQLPAIVQNNQNDILFKDIFEHTGIESAIENKKGHDWLVMLETQYRMHPDIASFAGHEMYGDMLKTADEIVDSRLEMASCMPCRDKSMCLIDLSFLYSVCVKTTDSSRINILSALICVCLAESFADKYEVGIITPYNAQSRLILSMVRDCREKDKRFDKVSCSTVHQFQGSEKPIIIYDAVDCFRMPYPGTLLTSLKNDTANRLFNVALTRTQGKFILVANQDYMIRKKISKKLLFTRTMDLMCRNHANIRENQLIETLSGTDSEAVFFDNKDNTWYQYLSDVQASTEEICIDIPEQAVIDNTAIIELAKILFKKKNNNYKIKIRAEDKNHLPRCLQPYTTAHSNTAMPVTIIDSSIIWYGQPNKTVDFVTEGTVLKTKYFPCLRFEGMHAVKSIKAFLE